MFSQQDVVSVLILSLLASALASRSFVRDVCCRNACLLRVQQQHRRRQKLRKKSPSGVNPFWGRRKRTQLKSCRCNLKLTACDKLQSQLRTNWDPSVIASFYSNTNSVRQNETFAFGKLLTVGSNGLEVIHWACWRGYIWDRH